MDSRYFDCHDPPADVTLVDLDTNSVTVYVFASFHFSSLTVLVLSSNITMPEGSTNFNFLSLQPDPFFTLPYGRYFDCYEDPLATVLCICLLSTKGWPG